MLTDSAENSSHVAVSVQLHVHHQGLRRLHGDRMLAYGRGDNKGLTYGVNVNAVAEELGGWC